MRTIEKHADDVRGFFASWIEQLSPPGAPEYFPDGANPLVGATIESHPFFSDFDKHTPRRLARLLDEQYHNYKKVLQAISDARQALVSALKTDLEKATGTAVKEWLEGESGVNIRVIERLYGAAFSAARELPLDSAFLSAPN